MTKWVDPHPFVILDTEKNQVVARAATEALAKDYFKTSLDDVPVGKYKIKKDTL